MLRKLVYLLMLFMLIDTAFAVTIHGTIYSFDLEKRDNTIVSVDSNPPQQIVSKDGTYSFDLDIGKYTISAVYSKNGSKESVKENINVAKEGRYILDLVLFPDLEIEEQLLIDAEEDIIGDDYFMTTISYFDILIIAVVVLGFGIVIYLILKHKKPIKNEETKVGDLADDVLEFIKKEDGRTTQKEIRQKFPLSEAKISLVVSELEHKGLIKRIKKGRGNVIVLN